MPIQQIDNTRVTSSPKPTGSYTHYDPKAPKPGVIQDTGTITEDNSNPVRKAIQNYTASYLNSNFANSPFMDVMRWLPGFSYIERVVTGQPVEENESLSMVMPIKTPQVSAIPGKTNYKLLERPVKISRAERLGIPKSDRKSFNEFDEVMENAKLFAEKHNLKIPENVEEVKNMYRDYNSFYRRVNTEFLMNGEKELGKYAGLPKEEQAKILATRGYPDSKYTYLPEDWGKFSQDRVFVSPTLEDTKLYEDAGGFLVKVQRPFKLSDLKNAHSAAEYTPIYERDIAGKLPMGTVLYTQGTSGWMTPNPTEYLVSTKHLIPREIMHK